jgi:hypothetical protein
MSTSSVSFGGSLHASAALQKVARQQKSSDFSSLASALGSNNLTGAQNAFATLQKDAQSASATQTSSSATQQTSALQQVKSDAQTLATALGSGNLGAAQQAFATLKQDSATAHAGHHHGGHHGGGAKVASSSSTSSPSSLSADYTAADAVSSVGTTLNLTA